MTPRASSPCPTSDKATQRLLGEAEQHIRFLRMERADGRIDPRVACELIATFDNLVVALSDANAELVRLKGNAVVGSYIV